MNIKWSTSQGILHKVPEHVPPVFAGDRLLFYALLDEAIPFDHTTTVELLTDTQQQPIGLARIDHVPPVLDSRGITRLAAKALLRELADAQKSTDREILVNLSIKYGILCPHTAFIGVEKRLNANSESNADMELREVPVMTDASAQNLRSASFYVRNLTTMSADLQSQLDMQACMLDSIQCSMQCASVSRKSARKNLTLSRGIGSITQPVTGFFSSLFSKQKRSKHDAIEDIIPTSAFPAHDSTSQPPTKSSSSTSHESSVAWPTDEQKLVDRFVDLQQYDGLWILTVDDVKQLTGKSLATFSSSVIKNMEEKQQQSIITTVLVIIILETRCSSVKTLWQALSNKANKRLKELLGGDETKLEQLMKDIRDQF